MQKKFKIAINFAIIGIAASVFYQNFNNVTVTTTEAAASTTTTTVKESANGSSIAPCAAIYDSGLTAWTVASGVVYYQKSGGVKVKTPSGGVEKLIYYNGRIYQTAHAGWWIWSSGAWATTTDPRLISANNAAITTDGPALVDANKNIWVLKGGVVYENGIAAGATSKVIKLAYRLGHLYQENSYENWYTWNGSSWPATPALVPPPQAAALGYTVSKLDDNFSQDNLAATVDLNNSQTTGYHWYLGCNFLTTATTKASIGLTTAGGVQAMQLGVHGEDVHICTQISGTHGGVGPGFGGSMVNGKYVASGAYYEARIAFDAPTTVNSPNFPAFWSLQGMDGSDLHWSPNTEDFKHSTEVDFMEFFYQNHSAPYQIGSTLHDWSGVQGVTCPKATYGWWCHINSQIDATDFPTDPATLIAHPTYKALHDYYAGAGYKKQPVHAAEPTIKIVSTAAAPVYHNMGVAYVPSVGGKQGYVEFFWDEVSMGKVAWTGQPPATAYSPLNPVQSPVKAPWIFGAADQHPYGLILETGGKAFMNVQWVHVWSK